MNEANIALLGALVRSTHPGDEFREDKILKLTSRDLYGTIECAREVWYSKSGFGEDDDVESVGFIMLPDCVALNERNCRHYKLSALSTSITTQFTQDWNKVIVLPHVSKEHQQRFFPFLFIK